MSCSVILPEGAVIYALAISILVRLYENKPKTYSRFLSVFIVGAKIISY